MIAADMSNKNPAISPDAQYALSLEVETTLLPILEKLKQSTTDPVQTARLVTILESNLQHLVKTYGNSMSLAATYQRLSPVEALVASLVRQGLATKDIATALSIAPGTVNIHRKHIRKKLQLDYKGINLRSYLQSLS